MVSEPFMTSSNANSLLNQSSLLLLPNMSNLMSIKLDSINYIVWKLQFTTIHNAYSMKDHIDGSVTRPNHFLLDEAGSPTLEINPAFKAWKQRDKALLALIYSTLTPSILLMVVAARDNLAAVGIHTDNEELLHIVLKGLPREFSSFCSAIRTRDDSISFEKLSVLLQTEEHSMKENLETNTAMAMYASNIKPQNQFGGNGQGSFVGPNRGKRESNNQRGRCGRFNNFNTSSFSSQPHQFSQSSSFNASQQFFPKFDSTRHQCKNPPSKLAAMAATNNPSQIGDMWLIDPGATDHITYNPNNLTTQAPYTGSDRVAVCNGQNLPINTIVHKLCQDNNCSCYFDSHKFSVQDLPIGKVLYKGLSENGVYPIYLSRFEVPDWWFNVPVGTSMCRPVLQCMLEVPAGTSNPNQSAKYELEVPADITAIPTAGPLPTTAPDLTTPVVGAPPTPTSTHSMQTQAKSGIFKPKVYYIAQPDYLHIEPPSYKVAVQYPKWCTAMQEEYDALQRQGTWSLVSPPPSKNIMDVRNAFMHGTLQEEVYMQQPPGYVHPDHPNLVSKLHKSLYGLKQAPKAWFESFTGQLLHLGFTASSADSSLFIFHDKHIIAYLLFYVDDIVITRNTPLYLDHLIQSLSSVFELKDLGLLSYFLGLQVHRTSQALYLSQTKYATDLLHKHHMFDTKPAKTPCIPNTRLTLTKGTPLQEPHSYKSLVGALHYLTFTRPDLSFAVHQVCQFMHFSTNTHFTAAKRILRYLRGTLHHGFLLYLGSNPITWSAKKQPTVSRSSTESENRALAITAAELSWLRTLLKDLHIYLANTPILWCNNVLALAIASNPVFHARTKHIEVNFHFVRERVLRKDLVVNFVSTQDQLANIFTKSLPTTHFLELQGNLMVPVCPHVIEQG
uniref:Reverse transcriptase Ty1/copia-type domain-containing protein n=1 Tax=Fagus sylvatica TaxID=28930 RepID=A0A2N9IP51_FAGSY